MGLSVELTRTVIYQYTDMKFFLLPVVLAANILITTTDSWVAKGPRYLEWALREDGHDVKVVASLNPNTEYSLMAVKRQEVVGVPQGGDFNHLLPVQQIYHRNIRKLNTVPRGVRNTISQRESDEFDERFENQDIVSEGTYGQDPLNLNFWYVDGLPLEALSVAFSEILPKHIADFKPDLVIVGPNEGLHLTSPNYKKDVVVEDLEQMENQAEALALLAQLKNYPVITVSSEDHDHIYYGDERYFNLEEAKYEDSFKANPVARNAQYINKKVVELVEEVEPTITPALLLNVNFPSMNHQYAHCIASTKGPTFFQVVGEKVEAHLGKILSVPQVYSKREADSETSYIKLSDEGRPEPLLELEFMRLLAILIQPSSQDRLHEKDDISKYYLNKLEARALDRCEVAVAVNHVTKGNNLGPDVFEIITR